MEAVLLTTNHLLERVSTLKWGRERNSLQYHRIISIKRKLTFGGKPEMTTYGGSFENEALENEDRSTKHPNLENEALKTRKRNTQISKTKHPKLETTVGRRITTLSLALRKRPNQVEAMDASAPKNACVGGYLRYKAVVIKNPVNTALGWRRSFTLRKRNTF